jgi:hypothetical protein
MRNLLTGTVKACDGSPIVSTLDPFVVRSEFGLGKGRFLIYGLHQTYNRIHIHTVENSSRHGIASSVVKGTYVWAPVPLGITTAAMIAMMKTTSPERGLIIPQWGRRVKVVERVATCQL